MKVSVLADNGTAALAVAHVLFEKYPEIDRKQFTYANCPLTYSVLSNFEFPRDLALSSLPITAPVKSKPFVFEETAQGRTRTIVRANAWQNCRNLELNERNGSGGVGFMLDFERALSPEDLAEEISTSDKVFLAYPKGSAGAHVARILRNWVSSHGVFPDYIFIEYDDILKFDEFVKSVGSPVTDPNLEEASVPSLIDQYFKYNYRLNSIPVMRATSMKALGRDVANALSSDMLQILYRLREMSGASYSEFSQALYRWRGTAETGSTVSIGWGQGKEKDDPSIDFLEAQGLAMVAPDRRVEITDDGLALLAAIHPDCCDADQAIRLSKWKMLDEAVARKKIDQYVKTFFGKQLRFMLK